MKKQLSILAMEEPIPEEHVGEKKEKILIIVQAT